jgi:hypothetical protein
MIRPRCYFKLSSECEGELRQFGGILLSPPSGVDEPMTVKKYHICVKCYEALVKRVDEQG